jgi:6-phosphogluconolactonase (cycloisomerase 2 family)
VIGRASRRLLVVTALFVAALLLAATGVPGAVAVFRVTAPVDANTVVARTSFGLTQTAGCFSNDGTDGLSGTCATAALTRRPQRAAVSPDGKNVYVVSNKDGAITEFSRDPATGALTALASPNRCVTIVASSGCTTVVGLDQLFDLVVSPDGKHVYAVAYMSSAVTEFSRDQVTGALSQLASPNACIVDPGVTKPAGCTVGKALYGANGISISSDGKFLYVSSSDGWSLASFSRDTTSGVLTQLTATGGCFYDSGAPRGAITGCTSAVGLGLPYFNRITSDGKNVYVASNTSSSIAAFTRNTTTGLLTQLASPNACYYTGTAITGCTAAKGLQKAYDVQVSPDGRSVYAVGNTLTSTTNYAVAAFTRDTTSGALTQLASPNACVYNSGSTAITGCTSGIGVAAPTALDFSPDGKYLFVAGNVSNGVAMFTHDNATGVITQMAGTNACISNNTAGCSTGRALKLPLGVTVSPDGRDVYVTSGDDTVGYIAVLNRTH